MRGIQLSLLALTLVLLYSCESANKAEHHQHPEPTTDSLPSSSSTIHNAEEPGTPSQDLQPTNTRWDSTTIIGEGIIWRKKDDESDKWSDIVATNIFGFKRKVELGEMVQLVPLRKELPILNLKVIRTLKRDEMAPDIWYEIDLENIPKQHEIFWTIDPPKNMGPPYPSKFLAVYPPIKNCTLLDPVQFDTKDLPANTSIEEIKGALDFDGDELPDALVCEFCCDDSEQIGNCEYTCGQTYLKVNKQWISINSSQPM